MEVGEEARSRGGRGQGQRRPGGQEQRPRIWEHDVGRSADSEVAIIRQNKKNE